MRRAKERSRQNFAVVLGFVERAVRSLPDPQRERERERGRRGRERERERERERKETTSSRGFRRKNTSSSSSSSSSNTTNTNNALLSERERKQKTRRKNLAAAHLLNLPHLDVLLLVVAHGRHLFCLLFCVYLLKNNVQFFFGGEKKVSSFFSLYHTVLGFHMCFFTFGKKR